MQMRAGGRAGGADLRHYFPRAHYRALSPASIFGAVRYRAPKPSAVVYGDVISVLLLVPTSVTTPKNIAATGEFISAAISSP